MEGCADEPEHFLILHIGLSGCNGCVLASFPKFSYYCAVLVPPVGGIFVGYIPQKLVILSIKDGFFVPARIGI
jgi:hypothetical protein